MFVRFTLINFDGRTALVDGRVFSEEIHVDVPGNSRAIRMRSLTTAIAHAIGSRGLFTSAVANHGTAIGYAWACDAARGRAVFSGEMLEVSGIDNAGIELLGACIARDCASRDWAREIRAAADAAHVESARHAWSGVLSRPVYRDKIRDASEACDAAEAFALASLIRDF